MKKNTRTNLILALSYSIILIAGMYLGFRFLKDQGYTVTKNENLAYGIENKRDEILQIIDKKYVDAINTSKLRTLPIDSMLHELDPHSVYLPPADAEDMTNTLEGNYDGVGLEYYMLNDTMFVTGVVKGGPANVAGIVLGDKILKIDTAFVSGRKLNKDQLFGRFRGKSGTGVFVTLQHPGSTKLKSLIVTRGKINVSSIDASYLLNPEVAYIRLSKFGANTDADFYNALNSLKASGMKKLILDLRDNGGGYLSAATGLADQFLGENKLIVYTQGKHEPRTDYFSTGSGVFQQGKLVVLINENTASASEIVAGAVQDLGRGVIIGRRSFGKGLVQEQFAFEDGSALNLTIARYYTPAGKSIQKSYAKGYNAYKRELDERMTGGELTNDRSSFKDSVQRGLTADVNKVKSAKTLGGIQPDIFVKLDTSGYNALYATLMSKKLLSDFVFQTLISRYPVNVVEKNINSLKLTENDFKDFTGFLQKKNILTDFNQLAAAKPVILNNLKATLYRYYFGDVGYYKAVNQSDNMIKEALSSLQP